MKKHDRGIKKHKKPELERDITKIAHGDSPAEPLLEVMPLGPDEKLIAFFTKEYEACFTHYINDQDIQGYLLCNIHADGGGNCALCQAGKERKKKLLLPVYGIEANKVQVLSINMSMRPDSLLPQISNLLTSESAVIAAVTRNGYDYRVDTYNMTAAISESLAKAAKKFRRAMEKGEIVSLSSVYLTINNAVLAEIDEVKRALVIKGISPRR